ncbi:acylphosphatase [Methanolobus sp. WCC1]|jgi:acylphosphatase|uniref:Acylphosphatase n=1 Tax=Methanolobus tindarius DSM 2278 TaxID=1090322 RepID=W9DN67_METTI|nr:acylphosphatase [Methanolobus tindarius]ETA67429.1 acylphosphatase [Methanolobus tindarius DSM 2278]
MQDKLSNAEDISSATILVTGRVQGVYFRRFTVDNAQKLGLVGFARNLQDGRVEVFAEGKATSIQRLIDFLHIGPAHANVEDVSVEWSEPAGEYTDFSIKR